MNNQQYFPQDAPYGQPMMDNFAQMRAPYAQPQRSGVIWVQGEAGAKAYMVAAGNNVLLLDSDNPVFYLKSTDPSGMPLPLRVFDYTERPPQPKSAPAAQPVANDYITRAEFEAALERLAPQKKTRKAQEEIVNE